MIILFPSDPLDPRKVDSAFEHEAEAAKAAGAHIAKVSLDSAGTPFGMWGLPRADDTDHPHPTIYRGWMLKPQAYLDLYRSALRGGALLVNSPDEYRYCHELPQWYGSFGGSTPKSVWIKPNKEGYFELDGAILEVSKQLGNGPYVVKDFVKSRKHEWDTACFIPDISKLVEVTETFLELQSDDLNGGLVYRQYIPLKQVGTHPKSGAPIHNEIRTWTLGGAPLMSHTYWGPDEGGGDIIMPRGAVTIVDMYGDGTAKQPLMDWRVKSNFFPMDIAEHQDGGWVVIELGDGQVSGLPEHADVGEFYEKLVERFTYGN